MDAGRFDIFTRLLSTHSRRTALTTAAAGGLAALLGRETAEARREGPEGHRRRRRGKGKGKKNKGNSPSTPPNPCAGKNVCTDQSAGGVNSTCGPNNECFCFVGEFGNSICGQTITLTSTCSVCSASPGTICTLGGELCERHVCVDPC